MSEREPNKGARMLGMFLGFVLVAGVTLAVAAGVVALWRAVL